MSFIFGSSEEKPADATAVPTQEGAAVDGSTAVALETAQPVATTEAVKAPAYNQSATVVVDPDACPREVKKTGRTLVDPCCAYTFGFCIFAFVVLSIAIGATAHPTYTVNSKNEINGIGPHYLSDVKDCCQDAYDSTGELTATTCIIAAYTGDWDPSRRRLDAGETITPEEKGNLRQLLEDGHRRLASSKNIPDNIWEGFGNRPEIPCVMIFVAILTCIGFIKAMEKCSATILFGTFFCMLVLACYLAIRLKAEVFWLAAAVIVLWVVVTRAKIQKAAVVISGAASAMLKLPSLMFTVYAWMIVSCALIGVYIVVNAGIGLVQEVDDDCEYQQQQWAGIASFIVNIIWNWAWQYANVVQIFFVAGCIGTFHFDRPSAVASLPLDMIKIAFTTSAGALSKIAVVNYMIAKLKKMSKPSCTNCCCPPMCGICNPVFWLAMLIRFCCLTFLNMLSKWCVIFHAFTGEAFWDSAKRSMDVLKKAGMDGMVLEGTAVTCFWFIGYGISVGFAFATWAWMGSEDVYDEDVLGGAHGNLLKWFMMIVMWILLLDPLFSILIVVLVSIFVGDSIDTTWIMWCCGLFTGAVVQFFFMQTTQALLFASNTMFVAIAIDKTHNVTPEGMDDNPLYKVTTDAIAEAVVVDENGNVVKQNESTTAVAVAGEL